MTIIEHHPNMVTRGRPDLTTTTVIVLDVVAIALWLVGCSHSDATSSGPLGLATALPAVWWLGVLTLLGAASFAWFSRVDDRLLLAQPILLAVVLLGTPPLVEPFARVPTGYVHVGLVEQLVRTGEPLAHFDARYSWPSFFATGALLTGSSGVASATSFLAWSPLVFTLGYCLAMTSIGRGLGLYHRTIALGLWLFVSANWVGQDYWSPQALAFLLALTFVAVVVNFSPTVSEGGVRHGLRRLWRWGSAEPSGDPARQRVITGLLLVLAAAIAIGHQLTPFYLVLVTLVLVVIGRRDLRAVTWLVAALAIAWLIWGAHEYVQSHLDFLTRNVGRVDNVVGQGVTGRVAVVSSLHSVVLKGRVAFALLVYLSAGIAAYRKRRVQEARLLGALTFLPLFLVALQSYGGELPLRILFFSSPFAALLVAMALTEGRRTGTARRVLAVTVAAALLVAFVVARWGNEEFEQVYPQDMAAAAFVYAQLPAPAKGFVMEAAPFSPFRTEGIDRIKYVPQPLLTRTDEKPLSQMIPTNISGDGFVLITEAQVRYGVEVMGAPEGWDQRLIENFERSGRGRVVFSQDGATVIQIQKP